MSNSCIGAMSSIITADPHKALSEVLGRLISSATPTKDAMIQALTTEGDNPVIKAYIHRTIRVMMPRRWGMGVYRSGYSSIHKISAMMPVCRPLTARMCERPADEKYWRIESGILSLYPHNSADSSDWFSCDNRHRLKLSMQRCCMRVAYSVMDSGACCCDSCQEPSARYCRYNIPLRAMNAE